MPNLMRPHVGLVINNKYRLVRVIGDGGMGSVYEARHEMLGSTVALKFLHPELSRRAGLVQRFLQEARVSAAIQSPHVVRVSDVDQTASGLAYIVMECIEGRTLQTLYEDLYRAQQRLSYGDALNYAMQILEGVEAAHRAGVVHRDLKPDNVMITKGPKGEPLIKLLDFGIAKLKLSGAGEKGLTRPGVMMGTPEYMAPEQAFSADAVDARADIFSLGVILFEMLAGRRPVGGDEPQQIASAYLTGQIAQLAELAPSVPANLARAVHKAMAAAPEDRFATVAELRAELEPFVSSPLGATPTPAAATPAHGPPAQEPRAEHRSVPKTLPPVDEAGPAALGARADAGPYAGRGQAATPLGGFALAAPAATPDRFSPAAAAVDPGLKTERPSSQLPPGGGGTDIPARPFEAPVPTAGYAPAYPQHHVAGTAMDPRAAAAGPAASREGRQALGLLGILLLAGGAAGAVVGGLYAVDYYRTETSAASADPLPVPPAPATTTLPAPTTAEPTSTSSAPVSPPPITTTTPPPATYKPPPTTYKPPPTTTTPPPTTTGRPPIVLPTGLPIPWPPLLPGGPTTPTPTTTAPAPTTTAPQPTTTAPAPTTTATTSRRPIIIRMPK